METKNNILKTVLVALAGFVLVIMIFTTFSTNGENKRLKNDIKDKISLIKKLESEKITIFESIKKDSLTILAKDAIILDLSRREDSLINNLKFLNHERIKIRNAYLNNDESLRSRFSNTDFTNNYLCNDFLFCSTNDR